MSNLEKWIKAILNEDADNLSIGSVRTLQMIKHEIERLQKEQDERKFTLQEMIDCWQAGCHSSMEMDFYFKDRFNIDIKQTITPI